MFLFKRYVDLRWDSTSRSCPIWYDSIPGNSDAFRFNFQSLHRAHKKNPSRSRSPKKKIKPRPSTQMKRPAPPESFSQNKRQTTPTPFQRGKKKWGKKYGGTKDSFKIKEKHILLQEKKRFLFNAMSISFSFQLYHDDPTIFWTPVQNSRPFWWFGSKGKNTLIEFKFIVLYTPQSSKFGWFRWFTQYQSAQKKTPSKRKGPPPYSEKKKTA